MNINFNILWFEDNDEWYTAFSDSVEDYIKDLCFQPKIKRFKNIPIEELESVLETTNFDLILADLNLEDGEKGHTAIQKIRDKNILADALFYSTDGVDKIRTEMKPSFLDGAYLSNRDDIFLDEKVRALIDKTVRRAEDVVNVRGMMLDNTSEFDEKLKEIIRKFLSGNSPENKMILDKYAHSITSSHISKTATKIEKLEVEAFIHNSLIDGFILDSNKLAMIVNKIFKSFYPNENTMKGFHNKFNLEIISERNKLAHAKKEPESTGVFYFIDKTGARTDYDSDKCREIRQSITAFHTLLDNALDTI